MLRIVLYHPEIPHNTGAAGRLAVATGAELHLIRPLGFSLEEKYLRRVGLDYWQYVPLFVWDSMEQLLSSADSPTQFHFLSTKATASIWMPPTPWKRGDYLVFGPESRGLPEYLLRDHAAQTLRIPMPGQHARSLNLSTSIAIVLYEALRCISFPS